jgi:hypothetical protein
MRKCLILVNSTQERSKDRQKSPELEALFLGSGLSLLRFYLTLKRHSSSQSAQQEGGASLLTAPPGRLVVVRSVVCDVDLTSPTGVDGVDFVVTVGSFIT